MASHQNLLILLDQAGSHENVTNNFVSLTHELLAALKANCCPILASSFIWKNILEKKREAAFALTQATSPEKPTLHLHAAINNRIAELYAHNKAQHAIAQIINTEFYSAAAMQRLKQENKSASWAYTDFVVMHDFQFDADAWQVYWVNDRLLLFVPKNNELLLGLNVDRLERVEDPCDLETLYLHSLSKTHEPFVQSLKKLFVTNLALKQQNMQPHRWTIILEGHGRNIHEAPRAAGRIRYIADLSLSEYKEVLNFFNTEITTHLLLSGSCQSSGLLWQKMLKNNAVAFTYPILLSCLTDITSYGYVIRPKLPFLTDGLLQDQDICIDTHQKTAKLNIDYLYRYSDFFTSIAQITDFDINGLQKLKTALPTLIEPHISNTPVFYGVYNTKALLYDPATTVYLDKSGTQSITCSQETILLDVPTLTQSLVIPSKKVPRIVSVTPGNAQHHLASIELQACSFDTIANLFWPLKGLSVDKQFFIDQLCCLPGESLKIIAQEQFSVVIKNLFVHVQKDAYMRFSFECNDQVYSAHARLIDKQPVIKDLHAMRRMVPEQYQAVYASLQQKRKSDMGSSIKMASSRRRGIPSLVA